MATCRRRSNEWFALQRRSSVRVVFIGGMMGTVRRGRCRRADKAVFLCGCPAKLKLVQDLLCGPAGPPRQNGPMYGLLRAAVYLSGHANRRSIPIHHTAQELGPAAPTCRQLISRGPLPMSSLCPGSSTDACGEIGLRTTHQSVVASFCRPHYGVFVAQRARFREPSHFQPSRTHSYLGRWATTSAGRAAHLSVREK